MPNRSRRGSARRHISGHVAAGDYRPHRLRALWGSTLGKKYVTAVTGMILAIFVVLHMLGNLKAIEGPGAGRPALDGYARFLRRLGSPVLPHNLALWIERVVLLLALTLHVIAITQLWRRNHQARPSGAHTNRIRSTISARTMKLTGFLVLAFVVFHILHFTTRTIHPSRLVGEHVYANAFGAFRIWWIVAIYVGAVLLLGFHMNHALWSGAQTAGLDNPDRNWFWRQLATGVTVATVVGFAAIPILFATGALPKPGSKPSASHHASRSGEMARRPGSLDSSRYALALGAQR